MAPSNNNDDVFERVFVSHSTTDMYTVVFIGSQKEVALPGTMQLQ